ncbi:hypothetical protein A2160_02595 [Candidatus Beckwithbacteria bacterium RBG_13_42_9]|uniref:Aminoglycoside N(3)-acetyltransferase n=1 Tax=Candidatus Beckwithbacteria bacterium RBG_13_42_9 TaxID=1797457 RepID=A0A1F5E7Q3_9BACT|nr:MAG: hypothetical protein A2160_02595 [Candidatus Beckwithbacteria bacterium RBG_13_42_9]
MSKTKQSKQALFQAENKKLYYSDFTKALKAVGVNLGDIVFIHSDIVFGKIYSLNGQLLLKNLINSIKESVGDKGTIIMPTFTYSFCKKEPYDRQRSKSTVGSLTEYFRRQDGVSRTIHPIFSAAIWGSHKRFLLKIGKDSFDRNSIFGKLHRLKGKILFFGADFQACTFIHYIEQEHGVAYRYMKTFKGIIKNNGRKYKDEYTYFVRYLNRKVTTNLSRLERYLLEKNLMRAVKIDSKRLLMIKSDVLFNEGYQLLNKDIYYFLKNKPK